MRMLDISPEDTDGQLAAEHHPAQLRPAAQKFLLQGLDLMMLELEQEHIIDWLQLTAYERNINSHFTNFGYNFVFIEDQEERGSGRYRVIVCVSVSRTTSQNNGDTLKQ